MDLQITCINKTNRQDPYDRIHNVGGENAGSRWKKSQGTVVSEIDARRRKTTGYIRTTYCRYLSVHRTF